MGSASKLMLILVFSLASCADAKILSQDPTFEKVVPPEAYKDVGAWAAGDYWVASGHSIDVGSLGSDKDDRTELRIGEEDARRRIVLQAAMENHPEVTEDSYDLEADITGFHSAATYKLENRAGVFLIGIAKKSGVRVRVVFNAKKARIKAIELFDAKQFKEAAARLSVLTTRGIQDDETVAYAKAASWHVNLDAGVTGDSRTEALNGLGQFYSNRGDYESSIRLFYKLYDEVPDSGSPSHELLRTLVNLSRKTHREDTAIKFEAEIQRRWPGSKSGPAPTSMPSSIRDAHIEEPYASLLARDELLLSTDGAAVVRAGDTVYFIAVGSASMAEGSTEEHLRVIKEGRIHAEREAALFAERETIIVHDIQAERMKFTELAGDPGVHSLRVRDSDLSTKLQGTVKGLHVVGTWKNPDGTVFFCALAIRMN